MRKIFTSITLSLVLTATLFTSCQKEETIENQGQLLLKEATIESPCECLPEADLQFFSTSSNNKDNFASVEVWNDNEKFYIMVTANASNTMDEIQLSYPFDSELDGEQKNCNYKINYNISYSETESFHTHTFEFDLVGDWACSEQQFAIRVAGIDGNPVFLQGDYQSVTFEYQQGQTTKTGTCENVPTPISYILHEICLESCEESFSYTDNQNGTVTFHYTPAEDMIDVPVVFTFPQVEFITFLSGYEYDSFIRPGNGNAQNMQAVLSFEACSEYSWTVQLVDCTASNATANGWTDFKVDGISKKNEDTPNFTYTCPAQ